MSFFIRASNGWDIASRSFKVVEANKQLIIFPLLSGISLFLILIPVAWAIIQNVKWDIDSSVNAFNYLYVFGFYLINYFVVVFFNSALTYSVSLYFKGEEVSIKKGIAYSIGHIGIIFSWALFAATIGTILRIIMNHAGFAGKLLAGIASSLFGLATYFVVPIMVFEKLGPTSAFKHSAKMVKEKWGETVGAAFNFVFIQFMTLIFIAIIAFTIGTVVNPLAGVIAGIFGIFMMLAVTSAARIIFITAAYHGINADPVAQFEKAFVEKMFIAAN